MNKKVSRSQQRLIELMNYFHLNQTELCKRTGLQKSALSNYLNGDREPRQDQISLIADPFNINPSWLMGYETPMFMSEITSESLSPEDEELLNRLHSVRQSTLDSINLLIEADLHKP